MSDLPTLEIVEQGHDTGRGNLLGIQPVMLAADYLSAAAFEAKLRSYLEEAYQRHWLSEKTIVVWPEFLGTWLVLADESPRLAQAKHLTDAMRALAFRHIGLFLRGTLSAKEKNKVYASFFRLKARRMAEIHNAVFSQLAKDYSATIVAGSIVLPCPWVEAGILVTGEGPLYNVCAVYQPDGQAYSELVCKIAPTTEELSFVTPAHLTELPTFETPAGRLGVLICADSWYPAPYEYLKTKEIDLLAVPSCLVESGIWVHPWKGYNGAPAPEDVDPGDVGKLTEGQAWHKYALAGRMAQSGAKHGINVFLRGHLWDMETDGYSLMVAKDKPPTEASSDGAALLNLWL